MITLRPYQEETVVAIFDYFTRNTGNPVAALPTGTGKSIVIAEFIRRACALYPGTRVLKLTHVKELIVQNFNKLLTLWPTAPAGIYSAGLRRRDVRPVTFAGIASVVKRAKFFGRVDLVIIDEAHMVSPKAQTMYEAIIKDLREANPYVKVIGLTATPYRLGQGLITDGGLFTDICIDYTTMSKFNTLLAQGYLAPLIPRSTGTELDVENVRTQAGEFVLDELQAAVDREEITEAALKESLELAHDRNHWLVFATGIEHTNHVAEALCRLGVEARPVHSKLTTEQRDSYIRDFREGKVRVLVNNNVLTTGFDFPQVDCIVVLRPTQSPGLWVQMLGRGTRPCEGKKNCLVLDFAANTRRLGPINDPVLPKRKGKGKGKAPVRVCEKCGTYNHASSKRCINCDFEFPVSVKFGMVAAGDALIVGDAPVVEIFKVNFVSYRKHTPRDDRPPSIAVSYTCGLRQFTEWVCIEHEGYAGKRARNWWRERDHEVEQYGVPTTTDEALSRCDDILTPTHLRVWVNKKYPEILAYDFTATAFNTQPVDLACEEPKVSVERPAEVADEDIPF